MRPKKRELPSPKRASVSAKRAKLTVVPSQRSRLRGDIKNIKDGEGPMIYLMRKDIRAQDNWSLLKCQTECRSVRVAHIIERVHPSFRLAWFYANGLKECETDLKAVSIPLDILKNVGELSDYLKGISASGLVADLNTLREFDLTPVINACNEVEIPCWEVDSYNIVPVWVASDKQEYAARTIRSKINNKLDEWLVDIPVIVPNVKVLEKVKPEFQVEGFLNESFGRFDKPPIKFIPGANAGKAAMVKFLGRISKFEKYRNDPTQDALSGLSPWIRFGHLSKQRIALEVKQNASSHKTFLEELIIRGELAENYTFYNPDYDNLKGAPNFGIKTLNDHADDTRDYVYTYQEFANAKTHDELWNAAQRQLVNDGKMHGFMRMYWAKKILEWSKSPEIALQIGIKLNDTLSMDGRDPRGYVGMMWSIAGLHDQGWRERPIFGKVRYMNYDGCKRKFDILKYIKKHPSINASAAPDGELNSSLNEPVLKGEEESIKNTVTSKDDEERIANDTDEKPTSMEENADASNCEKEPLVEKPASMDKNADASNCEKEPLVEKPASMDKNADASNCEKEPIVDKPTSLDRNADTSLVENVDNLSAEKCPSPPNENKDNMSEDESAKPPSNLDEEEKSCSQSTK